MPQVTSEQWRKWVQANDVDDPLVTLIEITHSTISTPIRVSSDMTQFIQLDQDSKEPIYGTISNGNTYYAFPFSFTVPDTPDDGEATRASFSLENVSREYVSIVRNLDSCPTLNVKFCLASAPNTIERTLPPLLLTNITMTATSITGELEIDDFRTHAFPALQFYPSGFQGLFS